MQHGTSSCRLGGEELDDVDSVLAGRHNFGRRRDAGQERETRPSAFRQDGRREAGRNPENRSCVHNFPHLVNRNYCSRTNDRIPDSRHDTNCLERFGRPQRNFEYTYASGHQGFGQLACRLDVTYGQNGNDGTQSANLVQGPDSGI